MGQRVGAGSVATRQRWPEPDSSHRTATLEARPQPPRCRLTVLVAVDQLDPAVISAVRYADLLRPARLNGFHVDRDQDATARLAREWNEHFGYRVPLVVADP